MWPGSVSTPLSTSASWVSHRKAAERDLAVAVAQRWEFGATTVSASVALAAAVGVRVFATGGIGGVHRGADVTGDISADLDALATHPVITVSAGAKAFLDLGRTLEYLETRGVPVLGWQHDWFPAFYTRSCGLPGAASCRGRGDGGQRVRGPDAGRRRARRRADPCRGRARRRRRSTEALAEALGDAEASGVDGAAVTPFVLGRIAAATAGGSVPANLALAERNAAVAGEIAVAVSRLAPSDR